MSSELPNTPAEITLPEAEPPVVGAAETLSEEFDETAAQRRKLQSQHEIALLHARGTGVSFVSPLRPDLSGAREMGDFHLANGTAGRPYQTNVALAAWKIKQPIVLYGNFVEELAALGLQVSLAAETLTITGTLSAQEAGEHTIFFDYTYLTDTSIVCRKKITLLLNPDPRTLWRTVEPDAALPDRKPHTATAHLTGYGYQAWAASRRGRSHAHEGKFREDDFALAQTDDGWYILLAADGAGSAACSRTGSRLACNVAQELLTKSLPEELSPVLATLCTDYRNEATQPEAAQQLARRLYQILGGAAFGAYKQIEQTAAQNQQRIKDYATTFLLSVVKRVGEVTFVAAFWIGDGGLGLYDEAADTVHLLGVPDGGEFSGQTRFLTMPEVLSNSQEMMRRVRFKIVENFTALVLLTDGVSDAKFGTDKNLLSATKWREFWEDLTGTVDLRPENAQAEEQLLTWLDFWATGEHDDRTLIILS